MAEIDLPKQVLLARLNSNMNKGTIHGWERALSDLNLPDIKSLTSMGGKNKPSWKRHIKKQIYISQQPNLIDLCDSYHVANISLKLGKPCRIWSSTRKCRINTPSANFRMRLITGCDGLESDASRFRYRKDGVPSGYPLCKICSSEPEDANHFIVSCPCLSDFRRDLILNAPASPILCLIPINF